MSGRSASQAMLRIHQRVPSCCSWMLLIPRIVSFVGASGDEKRPSYVLQLAQRLPRSHGRLLQSYVDKIGEMYEYDEVKLTRLQDLILQRIEKLAARGKVSPIYLKFTFCYWGDAVAEGQEG